MAKEFRAQKLSTLVDSRGRMINYLRISLTDRCNLKCIYCHPPHAIDLLDRSDICSYSEVLLIAKTAAKLGITKVRLTGGELFLRKGIMDFIQSLAQLEVFKEITLTTNGLLLLPHLKALKDIGIKRINVSLDTMSKALFYHVTGSRKFDAVKEAIHQALQEGFKIKINMVVLRGLNDGEINQFIDTFVERSAEVRFIEFMPLCGSGWNGDYFFPYEKIKRTITSEYDLYPLPSSGVAQEFAVGKNSSIFGKVGIIAPVTQPFCGSCSRLRLSAKGELRPCLFSDKKIDLLPILRGASRSDLIERNIKNAFKKAVAKKTYSKQTQTVDNDVLIRNIGG
jgi:cyclic pyranopterin phosphate synthase